MITIPTNFGTNITVNRKSAGSYVSGVWVDGAAIDPFTIFASVQPLNGRELINLPEAQRIRESIKIYSNYQLKGIDEVGKEKADIITHDGVQYEVQNSRQYVMGAKDHYKSIAFRVNQ